MANIIKGPATIYSAPLTSPVDSADLAQSGEYDFLGIYGPSGTNQFPIEFNNAAQATEIFSISVTDDYFNTGTFTKGLVFEALLTTTDAAVAAHNGWATGSGYYYVYAGFDANPLTISANLAPGAYVLTVIPRGIGAGEVNAHFKFAITSDYRPAAALFTSGNDVVDFNALTADQMTAASAITQASLHNALDGDDRITLPDALHAGNLVPGAAVPVVFGLNDPAPEQVFHGGGGADRFDFTKDQGLGGYAAGTTIYIDGDAPTKGANLAKPFSTPALMDSLRLPGSPGDYTFAVSYSPTLAATHTVVSRRSATAAGPAAPVNIDTANIERVTFGNPGAANVVTLDQGNLYAEMARLNAEVYGPLPTLTHGNEPLASGATPDDDTAHNPAASTVQVGDRAVARGWHEVSAMEMGLPPGSLDLPPSAGLRWSFSNGLYQAIGPTAVLSLFPTTEADALVLSGVVGGKRTLSVIFRGTDEKSDFGDYISFSANHYAKYAPLVEALKAYLADKDNGVDQVLIGGHSLGGGVAQLFAADLGSTVPSKTFTFGSPGAETPAGVPQVNFFQTLDPVAAVSAATQPATAAGLVAHGVAYAAAVAVFTAAVLTDNVSTAAAAAKAAALVSQLQPKSRSGTDVQLGTDISVPALLGGQGIDAVFASHAMGLNNSTDTVGPGYVQLIDKLVSYAGDAVSRFSQSAMAGAINAGEVILAAQAVQVGLGNGSNTGGQMLIRAGDRYDLGDRSGANDLNWIGGAGAGSTLHDIDGGPGSGNELDLLGGVWFWHQNGSHYDLYKIGALGVSLAGTFQRIQTVTQLGVPFSAAPAPAADLVAAAGGPATGQADASAAATATFDPASLVSHLDGTPTTVQQAGPGAATLAADGVSDVTYAGPGVTTLTSSAAHAVLAYGADTASVTVTGGRAIITSDGSPGGTIAIDTGTTASSIVGGARAEIIRGHLAGASFQGGAGDSTVAYDGASSAYTVTAEVDGFTTVSGAAAGSGSDQLTNIKHLAFTDQTMDLTTAPPADPTPSFAMTDVSAGISSTTTGDAYDGPVSYLQKQFIYAGADKIALLAGVPNAFLHGGTGDDALQATSGSNILDGGQGSNFLVGAAGADGGADTSYVDGRGGGVTWSTLVDFHHGDDVTLWGFVPGTSTMPWSDNEGAQGYQGATIHSELAGAGTGVNASVTFAGVSEADALSKFTTSTGSMGGNAFLHIAYTG